MAFKQNIRQLVAAAVNEQLAGQVSYRQQQVSQQQTSAQGTVVSVSGTTIMVQIGNQLVTAYATARQLKAGDQTLVIGSQAF